MKYNLLSKDYVMLHGVNYDLLVHEYCSDRMLDKEEEEGGQLFTGLAYELDSSGKLVYYGYYKDGFEEGENIYIYSNGNIESCAIMKRGRVFGEMREYFENGKLKAITHSEYGVILKQKKWDESGNLIYEKKEPTSQDLSSYESGKQWHERVTNCTSMKGDT